MSGAGLQAATVENANFTTSGALTDLVDKKVLIVLRDNRKITGVLRSYDQYANLVLQQAVEHFYHGSEHAKVPRGIYLIRGENVVLMGEVDLELEDLPIPGLSVIDGTAAPQEPGARKEVEHRLQRVVQQAKQDEERQKLLRAAREKWLKEAGGFSEEHAEGQA